jgi:hypothetical protein
MLVDNIYEKTTVDFELNMIPILSAISIITFSILPMFWFGITGNVWIGSVSKLLFG